jgi:outer membrane protein OmpA-like peptidoglycan-associated protein
MMNGTFQKEVHFCDFDNKTGKLSNPHMFKIPEKTQMWSIEFSPNSSKLLIGGMKYPPTYEIYQTRPYICQIDLEAKHPYEITRYAHKIFMDFVPKDKQHGFWPQFMTMQLASNGKIYTYIYTQGYEYKVIALENPNALAKDYKITFSSTLPRSVFGVFPNCTHLLPNETELSTVFAVGKVFTRTILFDTNEAILKPEYESAFTDIVAYLLKNPKTTIEIAGHTDNEGEEAKNKTLSENRAQALADFLIKNKIDKERIKAIGYGSAKPIADNSSPAGKAKNRRIEFLIK